MDALAEQFVGTWSLLDYTVTNLETGVSDHVLGADARGHIIYTPEGWVSATLMTVDRRPNQTDRQARYHLKEKLESEGMANLSAAEQDFALPFLLAAFGYIAYCGPFEADSTHVHHHIEEAFFPAYVGNTATRAYQFEGDELYLSAEAYGGRDQVRWRRVPNRFTK
ncbi:MAG: lipocalin-like domain-containing protein [Pseudomonadota bacterium]